MMWRFLIIAWTFVKIISFHISIGELWTKIPNKLVKKMAFCFGLSLDLPARHWCSRVKLWRSDFIVKFIPQLLLVLSTSYWKWIDKLSFPESVNLILKWCIWAWMKLPFILDWLMRFESFPLLWGTNNLEVFWYKLCSSNEWRMCVYIIFDSFKCMNQQ